MTGNEKITKLLSVTSRLTKLLQEENEILSHPGRADGLKELLSEKQNLSHVYEQQMRILDDQNTLQESDPALRRRLKEAVESFNVLADENQLALMARMEATKRVFAVIQQAAQEHQGARSTYGVTGEVESSVRQAYRPAVSVGVNHDI